MKNKYICTAHIELCLHFLDNYPIDGVFFFIKYNKVMLNEDIFVD